MYTALLFQPSVSEHSDDKGQSRLVDNKIRLAPMPGRIDIRYHGRDIVPFVDPQFLPVKTIVSPRIKVARVKNETIGVGQVAGKNIFRQVAFINCTRINPQSSSPVTSSSA